MTASPQIDLNVRSGPQMREYVAIADRIAADGPSKVLDWGCGLGQMSSLLRRRGVDTVAYDYRPDEADGKLHPLELRPEVEARFGDDHVALPYADDEFDAALSCGVLEHVADPAGSLRELRRVLKPGGTLYVYKLPNRASWTEWLARRLKGRVFYHGMAPYDRLYSLSGARQLLAASGFVVFESRYANLLPLLIPLPDDGAATARLWQANRLLNGARG
ncbi:MAG TPA: class I SAM-dependent methyltransferase, partial [Solirubrobacteraceae bacterium]|nr:class I SAM-dependent methyltransferase [Solirubrobacteraceae bacterium]